MSNPQERGRLDERVEAGYTPTGATKHLLETWDKTSKESRTICNSVARTLDQMVDQFNLSQQDADRLRDLPWCSRCTKWVESMTAMHSRGVKTKASEDIVQSAALLMGLEKKEELAKVIVLADWKKRRR